MNLVGGQNLMISGDKAKIEVDVATKHRDKDVHSRVLNIGT